MRRRAAPGGCGRWGWWEWWDSGEMLGAPRPSTVEVSACRATTGNRRCASVIVEGESVAWVVLRSVGGLRSGGWRISGLLRIDDRLSALQAWWPVGLGWSLWFRAAALRFARLRLPTRPARCVAGRPAVSRFKSAAGGPFLGERPWFRGCRRWRGGLGFGVVGSVVCSLPGRTPEAIRNLPGGQAAGGGRWCGVRSRRLTSRQNPDRASPARPRREHTPRRPVRAALRPGPRSSAGPDGESCMALIRPTRSGSPVQDPCRGFCGQCRIAHQTESCITGLSPSRLPLQRPGASASS